MIRFTRAHACSKDSLSVSAIRNDAEPFQPDGRFFRYDELYPVDERWSYEDFRFHIQSITIFDNPDIHDTELPDGYYVLMSSEGHVHHAYWQGSFKEVIDGAGAHSDHSNHVGRLTKIAQIGMRLYACGEGGQVYVRSGRAQWNSLTKEVLLDRAMNEAREDEGPQFPEPGWAEWIAQNAQNPPSRNYQFNGLSGLSENAIYLCGEEGVRPALFHWDGAMLEKLTVPLAEAALTGLHIESPQSVWVCGREGVILHGSREQGFAPVDLPTRNNLFHGITSYQGKLVLPASVRPGGLYQLDPRTRAFGRFDPPLPPLTPSPDPQDPKTGPFFAQGVDNVLWVVASRDIYRFDGTRWERIEHPDMP